MDLFTDIDNIFFDFDGTLCDTAEDIKAAWRAAIAEMKLDPSRFERVYRIGPPTAESARSFFPDADETLIERLCDAYWKRYWSSDYPCSHAYPGVDAMLKKLKAAGRRLYIATNKNGFPLRRLVEKLGWSDIFDELLHRDLLPPGETEKAYLVREVIRRERLDPRRSAMVGDTSLDIAAGRAAGIAVVAVDYGYGFAEELAGADGIMTLGDVAALGAAK